MVQLSTYSQVKQLILNVSERKEGVSTHLMGSMITAFITVFMVHPVDSAKSRIMNNKIGSKGDYSSVLNCLYRTAKNEGFLAVYKGKFDF